MSVTGAVKVAPSWGASSGHIPNTGNRQTHRRHEVTSLTAAHEPVVAEILNVVLHHVALDLRVFRRCPVEGRLYCEQRRERLSGIQRALAFLRFLHFSGERVFQDLQASSREDLAAFVSIA